MSWSPSSPYLPVSTSRRSKAGVSSGSKPWAAKARRMVRRHARDGRPRRAARHACRRAGSRRCWPWATSVVPGDRPGRWMVPTRGRRSKRSVGHQPGQLCRAASAQERVGGALDDRRWCPGRGRSGRACRPRAAAPCRQRAQHVVRRAAREVGAADRAGEEQVAGEQHVVAALLGAAQREGRPAPRPESRPRKVT
jgi:hypothetical protein